MKTTKVSSFAELVEAADSFMSSRRVMWRGHAESQWQIDSSLKRFFDNTGIADSVTRRTYEKECVSAYMDLDKTVVDSEASIFLSMVNLQHYGCPTRLIDFTFSLYAALFFALRDEGGERSLFGFDYSAIDKNSHGIDRGRWEDLPYVSNKIFIEIDENMSRRCPFPVRYQGYDRRVKEQQGVFLFEVDTIGGSHEYLSGMPDNEAVEIRFGRNLDEDIVRNLKQMNVDGSHLFEGNVGYAEQSRWALRGVDKRRVPNPVFERRP
jgi:FRG domain